MPVQLRRISTVFLGLVGLVLLSWLALIAGPLVVWRTRWQPGIEFLRRYNKTIVNPRALRTAGKTGDLMTVVHHRGRKSGREYVTPVWAEHVGQSFYIQLPYGTHVDWCHNLLAHGGGVLENDGVAYNTTDPTIVPAFEVLPSLSPGLRRIQRLAAVESYLRLDIVPAAEAG